VKDTGIGIRESDRAKLFTKFFRSDDDYAKNAGGTGLGLSIVKTIAEKHGGTVTVTSKLNEGSEFKVVLPVKKRQPEEGKADKK
jgi:two-component system phosphate regulon sensor histidine kinase PhoR